MSEGEGGYRPPSIDNTKSRRTFLKDMLKVGAGVAAAAAGVEMLPGQRPIHVEAASPEKGKTTEKVLLLERESSEFKPIGTKYQILASPALKQEDITKIQMKLLAFAQIGSTAVSVTDELIKKAQSNENLTQQQIDAINKVFVDTELKVLQILYPQNSAP